MVEKKSQARAEAEEFFRDDGTPSPMEDVARNLAAYWMLYLIRGIVVTAFGIFFLADPSTSMGVLTTVFGTLFVLEGMGNLFKTCVVCFGTDSQTAFCLYSMLFLGNTILGIVILVYPNETLNMLIWFVALAFLIVGAIQIIVGVIFCIGNVGWEASLGISFLGLLYTILAGLLMSNLNESKDFVIRLIGGVITLFGIQLLYLAKRLKEMNETLEEEANMPKSTVTIEELPDDNDETAELTKLSGDL
ncbi:unnamed protein product [Cylindrotheca closterium]|uniref:Uncharacterized protein n=1 Tax=Cylindrotheca closterium TaxID=2856 RepID=A0AAD2CMA1_9STRA|nr:unnamed protein product [Cylindrotheca closterium]